MLEAETVCTAEAAGTKGNKPGQGVDLAEQEHFPPIPQTLSHRDAPRIAQALAATSQTADHSRCKRCFEVHCFDSLENKTANHFPLKKIF